MDTSSQVLPLQAVPTLRDAVALLKAMNGQFAELKAQLAAVDPAAKGSR